LLHDKVYDVTSFLDEVSILTLIESGCDIHRFLNSLCDAETENVNSIQVVTKFW